MNAAEKLPAAAARPMGVYHGMSFEDYHAVDAVSSSGLRLFARSPWHFKHRVKVKPTRPMLRGTLVHCALAEPDAMAARYVIVPDGAPKRPTEAQWNAKKSSESSEQAKAWWREWQQQAGQRQIVSAEDFALCRAQLAAISAVPELAELLSTGAGEVSIFWIDPATRLYCKARLDWLSIKQEVARIVELKSTADESPSAFGRTAARMKYDIQRAHYIDAVKYGARMKLCAKDPWTWAVVTSAAPVLAVPYDLTDEMIDQATDERAELMERLAWCKKENTWPAYGSGKQLLDFPAYAKRSSEVEIHVVEES